MSENPVEAGLRERLARRLAAAPRAEVAEYAQMLAQEAGALAVLFYGSNLRTESLEGVLDFYLLMPGDQVERIWPKVSYREWHKGGEVLRAKIAAMSLTQFAKAASGQSRDTTIWARFVQPCALIWARDEQAGAAVLDALCSACVTAGRLAAALKQTPGSAEDFWRALFRATYAAEFRVEKAGREDSILSVNQEHFDGLLPLAWEEGGLAFTRDGEMLTPTLDPATRKQILRWWRRRQKLGKPLNLVRLAKATTTFEGAAAYGAWKLERHTGIALEVTPFREKHPLLAAPGALVELWFARRKQGRQ
ncbi:hypothetical protein ACRAQ7_04685 [Erythrobacter sp. W53]|uniref:hypothetical protein n=1 Tax=Erythrobacter sp. W53 TaxID=3425947 RepID=UPI003D769F67